MLTFKEFILILIASIIYAFSTILFIFPHSLLLGGTSGISVILNEYLTFSPGTILVIINTLLIVIAFVVLGKGMAVKTFIGSALTTYFVGFFEAVFQVSEAILPSSLLSAVVGAAIIALASGIMFYVDSSSGGTDIIALIVKKYCNIKIGRALLATDILIVIIGGIISDYAIAVGSFIGLLVKTFGIDCIINIIKKRAGEKN